MLQTRESQLRRRVTARVSLNFPFCGLSGGGMTDYVDIINRFAPEGIIGEWIALLLVGDRACRRLHRCGYCSAKARRPDAVAVVQNGRARAYDRHAHVDVSRSRAGRRVLSGRIMRGVAERIDAVIWFSDLRGFTRITYSAPEQVIPLLNDYADVIVSAIHTQSGDVL